MNEEGIKCASCGAPYHEASGHRFTETMVICGPCTKHFVKFIKSHTSRRWGGLKFYDYAATSVKGSEGKADGRTKEDPDDV